MLVAVPWSCAVNASCCTLVLHTHRRATAEPAGGKHTAGSKAGNAHAPSMRLRCSQISDLRKQTCPTCAALWWSFCQGSPQWPNRGKRLFSRKHTHVSTPSTLEIYMYSLKLKVFLTCNPLYSTETSLKLWKLKSQLIWTGTEIRDGMLTWTRCGSDPQAFKTWWCVYLGTVQHWALISLYLIFWEKASFYKASIAKRNKKVQHTTLYEENLTLSPQNISVSSVIFGCIFTDRVIPRPLLLWWNVDFFI